MKKIKLDMDGKIIAYLLWAIVVHESVVVSLVVDLILDSRMKIHTNLNIFFEIRVEITTIHYTISMF